MNYFCFRAIHLSTDVVFKLKFFFHPMLAQYMLHCIQSNKLTQYFNIIYPEENSGFYVSVSIFSIIKFSEKLVKLLFCIMQIAQGVGLSLVHFLAMWPVRVNKMSHTQSLSVGFMENMAFSFLALRKF